MTTPADVLRIASAEIGYRESPRGSNRTKFGVWYGMNGVPWCAEFVSWVFWHAGLPLRASTAKGFSYTPAGYEWFKKTGRAVKSPAPGDVVFFRFPGHNRINHVGIVESIGRGFITTIEGNTSASNQANGGMVMRRQRSMSLVAGYGRPAYSAQAVVVARPASPPVMAYDPNKPGFLVYRGSPEAAFLWQYRGGSKKIGPTGVPYSAYQVIEFDQNGPVPNPIPKGSIGVGTHVAGWGQWAAKDRYQTLHLILNNLGI